MLLSMMMLALSPPALPAVDAYVSPDTKIEYTQNLGQWDRKVKFMAQYNGANVWVTGNGLTYAFQRAPELPGLGKNRDVKNVPGYAVGVEFLGSNPGSKACGLVPRGKFSNFYMGNDRNKWVSRAPSLGAAVVQDLYPGIDLVSYADRQTGYPRYDLIVHKGADPSQIRMRYNGAKNLHTDEQGQICYSTPMGNVIERQQVGIQERTKGAPIKFQVRQELQKDGTVTFDVDGYRKDMELVIDPLVYSTMIGSQAEGATVGLRIGSDGTNYVSGLSLGAAFPGGLGGSFPGVIAPYVVAVSSDGQQEKWATYWGGSGYSFTVNGGIGVDASDNVHIAGKTLDTDFPTTDSTSGQSGLFATTINGSTGALQASTLITGTFRDYPAIAVHGSESYVLTRSNSAATTAGAFQPSFAGGEWDAYIVHLGADGVTHLNSTYLGGSNQEEFGTISVAPNGLVYVTGNTLSADFPLQSEASQFQTSIGSNFAGFVVALSSDLSQEKYSTLFATKGRTTLLALHAAANGIAVGGCRLGGDYSDVPATGSGVLTGTLGSNPSLVALLSPDLSSLQFCSYLPSESGSVVIDIKYQDDLLVFGGRDLTIDSDGVDPRLPCTPNAIQSEPHDGDYDGYVGAFDVANDYLKLLTYFGGTYYDDVEGLDVTSDGLIRFAGSTSSTDLPTLNPIETSVSGRGAGFLACADLTGALVPPTLTSDRGNAPKIAGGVGKILNVMVTLPDSAGGSVTLSSTNPDLLKIMGAASKTVTLPAGMSTVSFLVQAVSDVASETLVPVTATARGASKSLTVHVVPWVKQMVFKYAAVKYPKTNVATVSVFEAPATDQKIALSDDSDYTYLPTTATVKAGTTSVSAAVYTVPVPADSTATVTAAHGPSSTSSAFNLPAPVLTSFTVSPNPVSTGKTVIATVKFDAPVASPILFHGLSDFPTVIPDFDLVMSPLASSASIEVPVEEMITPSDTNVTLTLDGWGRTAKTKVLFSRIASLTCTKSAIAEGNTLHYTVTMEEAKPYDRMLQANRSDGRSSFWVNINANETTAQFDVTTPFKGLKAATNLTITVIRGSSRKSWTASLNPAISSITLLPSSVSGGIWTDVVVTPYEPLEYDLPLQFSSSSTLAYPLYPLMTLPAGSEVLAGNSFITKPVSATKAAKIIVKYGAGSKSATLTITP